MEQSLNMGMAGVVHLVLGVCAYYHLPRKVQGLDLRWGSGLFRSGPRQTLFEIYVLRREPTASIFIACVVHTHRNGNGTHISFSEDVDCHVTRRARHHAVHYSTSLENDDIRCTNPMVHRHCRWCEHDMYDDVAHNIHTRFLIPHYLLLA
jgi:hypothetical protein